MSWMLVVFAPVALAALRPVAVPVDPVPAIVDAFRTHQIVAISDPHGNEQMHAFLVSLIRDPRFADAANDIVVEFGNARYQQTADRFVAGEPVPPDTLRLIWRNSTQPSAAADLAMHEEILRAVRDVNRSRPRERQLRVLLGDPPIEWDAIQSKEDHFKWIEMRDAHPAAIVQVEVLAKRRRALLVYGLGHLQRKNVLSNFDMTAWQAQTIVSLLERAGPTKIFTIWGHAKLADLQPDVASWQPPQLAVVRGTTLGGLDAAEYFSGGARFALQDGKMTPVPRDQWRTLLAEEQFDGLLYLGSPSAMTDSRLSPALCQEPGWMEMRLKRIALAGLPPHEAERVKQHCGKAPRK